MEEFNHEYIKTPGFRTGHAPHLENKADRRLYRFLEMVPGLLAWGSILLIVFLSYFKPVWAAYFIIAFDLYWVLKTAHLSLHHRHNWKRLRHNMKVDWNEMLEPLKHDHLHHMIILPSFKEERSIVETAVVSLLESKYDTKKIMVVLAMEERAGEVPRIMAEQLKEEYGDKFGDLIITIHPKDIPGELAGKGSNITYAAERAKIEILDKKEIKYEDVLVSAFDVDTIVGDQYLSCLTWHFLTTEDRYNASYQPVPLYNNNIWEAPSFSRVAAMSSTFWQMIQQERQEKLTTFSSHSVPFSVLEKIGYWQTNMVSEDSRIFWNLWFAHNGNYKVVPISYPVLMDANLTPNFLSTAIGVYKQHLRWGWGVENVPYIMFNCIKHKQISLKVKIKHIVNQLEGFWSLATNPLVILLLGWLPLILGGSAFRDSILSYNLPLVTRNLMVLAMGGLVLSAIIAFTLIPPMPKEIKWRKLTWFIMGAQWLLIPITIVIFGAIPGLDGQTRLMFGKYMGFRVTPKIRKKADKDSYKQALEDDALKNKKG